MARGNRCLRLGLITFALWWGSVSTSSAGTPIEQVKETIDRVLGILQGPMVAGATNGTERREMLRRVLSPRFDFTEMAKIALGTHWNRQAARQKEFVSAFTDFVENSYVTKIESLKDKKIVYARERVDGGLAQVDTRIVLSQGDDIPIHYKLHLVGGEWKIYDVLIENISQIDNYRSQFNRILNIASFDELLKKLQQKKPAQ